MSWRGWGFSHPESSFVEKSGVVKRGGEPPRLREGDAKPPSSACPQEGADQNDGPTPTIANRRKWHALPLL